MFAEFVAFGLGMFADCKYMMVLVAIESFDLAKIAKGIADNQIDFYMFGTESFLAVLVSFDRFDLEHSNQKIDLIVLSIMLVDLTIEIDLTEIAIEMGLVVLSVGDLIGSGQIEVAIEQYFVLAVTAMTEIGFEAVVEDYFGPFAHMIADEQTVAGMFVEQVEFVSFAVLVELIVLWVVAITVTSSVLSNDFEFDSIVLENRRQFVLDFLAAIDSVILGMTVLAVLVDIVGIGYYLAGQLIEKIVLGLGLDNIDLVTDLETDLGWFDRFLEAVVT